MKASEAPRAIRSATRFASPETPQHEPVEVDTDHASLGEASLPDGEGRIEGVGETNHDAAETQFERTHTPGEFEHKGENDKRVIKKTRVAERHVQSKPGLEVAKERHQHVASVRVQREKENFGK